MPYYVSLRIEGPADFNKWNTTDISWKLWVQYFFVGTYVFLCNYKRISGGAKEARPKQAFRLFLRYVN